MKKLACLIAAAVLFAVPAACQETPQTVGDLYQTICSGALKYAVPIELSKGVLAQCGDIMVTVKDLEEETAKSPEYLRKALQKYPVYVLEQILTKRLIAKEALEWAKKNGKTEKNLEEAYLLAHTPDCKPTEEEINLFYKEHSKKFGGATLKQIRNSVAAFVEEEKRFEAQTKFKSEAGKRNSIKVSASWLKEQNEKWRENPVEKARLSGKPALAVFSVIGCCDVMYPIFETLLGKYSDKFNAVFINVSDEQVLGNIYGAMSIPLLIFYDSKGTEKYRSNHNMTEKEIIGKFREMGAN